MKGVVTVPLLNVRMRPGGRIVGRLKMHEEIEIFEDQDEWYEIEYRGVPRYVMSRYILNDKELRKTKTAKVNVPKLRVRKEPQGTILGIVKRGELVYIVEKKRDWYKILFEGSYAYLMGKYVDVLSRKEEKELRENEEAPQDALLVKMKGKVNVRGAKLNVRNLPDGEIVGKLQRNDIVEIYEKEDDWYKINFDKGVAYTSANYIVLIQGVVTASSLNVRIKPDGDIIGKIKNGALINILEDKDGWIQFLFNNQLGYVSGRYVKEASEGSNSGVADRKFFHDRKDLRNVKLEPIKKLEVSGSKEQKLSASIWNQYGNLIKKLSAELKIDVASAVAVLCVESGGNGFSADGRMLIRFENHLFYNFWGKNNRKEFDKHFKFNAAKRWMGHSFRAEPHGEWLELHTQNAQKNEWKALEFARKIDDTKALYSISMGAPQVMGFNHKIIGYDTVQEMFDRFNESIYYHICALFDFCLDRPERITYLQNKDFVSFAREYNGPGQPQKYGAWIKAYYKAFPMK